MWRRSREENFFILKSRRFSGSIHNSPRLYFTQTSSDPRDSTLRLIDENTGEFVIVKIQLSDHLTLPQLGVCIILPISEGIVFESTFHNDFERHQITKSGSPFESILLSFSWGQAPKPPGSLRWRAGIGSKKTREMKKTRDWVFGAGILGIDILGHA